MNIQIDNFEVSQLTEDRPSQRYWYATKLFLMIWILFS